MMIGYTPEGWPIAERPAGWWQRCYVARMLLLGAMTLVIGVTACVLWMSSP